MDKINLVYRRVVY